MADVWERMEEETPRAYEAFGFYRDLGASRSLDKAFAAQQTAQQPQNSPKTAPRHWTHWARDFVWVERAQAYDAHRERQARSRREAEHDAELDAYRTRQKKLAIAVTEGSIGLLNVANRRLSELTKLLNLNTDEANAELAVLIPVKSLPAIFRAAAACADAGTNAEATALAVGELLTSLNGENTSDSA